MTFLFYNKWGWGTDLSLGLTGLTRAALVKADKLLKKNLMRDEVELKIKDIARAYTGRYTLHSNRLADLGI